MSDPVWDETFGLGVVKSFNIFTTTDVVMVRERIRHLDRWIADPALADHLRPQLVGDRDRLRMREHVLVQQAKGRYSRFEVTQREIVEMNYFESDEP